jgi:LacI family transcriptional regulator
MMAKRRKTVKLRDIAIKAGVSVNTVSRALRHKPDVGEATRKTILNIAKELGYAVPGQAISRNKNFLIGVLIQDILNPFYAKVVQGIESVLWQERANFLFGCSYRQESKERDLIEFFSQQQVDGLLITSAVNPDYVLSYTEHSRIPTVFLSQRFEQYQVDYVINDNFEGAMMATDHLLKLGHTRIAHLMALETEVSVQERFRGYQEALKRAGIQVNNRLLRSGDSTIESGYYLTKDLLQSGEPMTAIFAYNDLVALGAFRALKEANVRVPTDLSLVGYDDIVFAEFFEIPLTTVQQPTLEISRKATELLFAKIKAGSNHNIQQIVLKPRLAIRSSTSICPA